MTLHLRAETLPDRLRKDHSRRDSTPCPPQRGEASKTFRGRNYSGLTCRPRPSQLSPQKCSDGDWKIEKLQSIFSLTHDLTESFEAETDIREATDLESILNVAVAELRSGATEIIGRAERDEEERETQRSSRPLHVHWVGVISNLSLLSSLFSITTRCLATLLRYHVVFCSHQQRLSEYINTDDWRAHASKF